MKNVEIKFFSSIKEEIGSELLVAELNEEVETVEDLLKWLQGKYLNFEFNSRPILVAKNLKYVKKQDRIENGDVIAIFPPVSGG